MRASALRLRGGMAALLLGASVLAACGGAEDNGNGGLTQKSAVFALFDPTGVSNTSTPGSPIVPFPFDGLFAGFSAPTLNIPNSAGVPFVTDANRLDGFSTVASIFADFAGFVDLATVPAGLLVINSATGTPLVYGTDYTVQPSTALGSDGVPISQARTRLLIEPLKPLAPSTRYIVVLTSAIKSVTGVPAVASDYFAVVRSGTPVSQQTAPLLATLSAAQKALLETLRAQLIRPVVVAVETATMLPETSIVLAWSFTTQSTTKTLDAVASAASASTIHVAPTGRTTTLIGGAGLADIYAGTIALPYYLQSAGGNVHSTAPLTDFWAADPAQPDTTASFLGQVPCAAFAGGVALPDGQTATPSASTTACFPVPVVQSTQVVPVLVAVPNATSGHAQPGAGWPVVVFQHGITGDRTQMLAIADALAAAGFVTVAIDLPLHGLTDATNPLYRNQLFAGTAAAALMTGERTFDLDLENNSTMAPGPDGVTDPSGTWFLNLPSLITSRDNVREAVADLVVVARSVSTIDLNGDGVPDTDGTSVRFVGHSLGGIVGGSLLGVDQDIGAATLAMPGGGIAKLLDASATFGPIVSAGLAANGLVEGTDNYETYMRFAQTLLDSGDPINFATSAAAKHPILMLEVVGDATHPADTVVPNNALSNCTSHAGGITCTTTPSEDRVLISGFLSGTDPLARIMGLAPVGPLSVPIAAAPTRSNVKLLLVSQFAQGNHGSILSPLGSATNAAVTCEMQRETASFLASGGTLLPIGGACP